MASEGRSTVSTPERKRKSLTASERQASFSSMPCGRRSRMESAQAHALAQEALQTSFSDPTMNHEATEADRLIQEHDTARAKRTAELHREWHRNVYEPIKEQISDAIESAGTHFVERATREMQDRFLNTLHSKSRSAGRKAGVFLDSVVSDEYDPMSYSRATGGYVARISNAADPLKRSLHKSRREWVEAVGPRPSQAECVTAHADARSRTKGVLEPTCWSVIESTPHGWMTDAEGNLKTLGKTQRAQTASIELDHFSYPSTNEAAYAELQLQRKHRDEHAMAIHRRKTSLYGAEGDSQTKLTASKRRVSPPDEQGDSFGVIHQLDDAQEVNAKRDSWLSRNGKRKLVQPSEARLGGKSGLSDVLTHSAPRISGCGDAWLDTKGKKRLPGPSEENPTMRELLSHPA